MAFAELLSWQTLGAPVESFGKFWGEFAMVAECCTERSWLAGMQPHLVHYVPQAVPFFSWVAWPPFFDHPFYAILPIIALPAFIFYDALAGFNGSCRDVTHTRGSGRARRLHLPGGAPGGSG